MNWPCWTSRSAVPPDCKTSFKRSRSGEWKAGAGFLWGGDEGRLGLISRWNGLLKGTSDDMAAEDLVGKLPCRWDSASNDGPVDEVIGKVPEWLVLFPSDRSVRNPGRGRKLRSSISKLTGPCTRLYTIVQTIQLHNEVPPIQYCTKSYNLYKWLQYGHTMLD